MHPLKNITNINTMVNESKNEYIITRSRANSKDRRKKLNTHKTDGNDLLGTETHVKSNLRSSYRNNFSAKENLGQNLNDKRETRRSVKKNLIETQQMRPTVKKNVDLSSKEKINEIKVSSGNLKAGVEKPDFSTDVKTQDRSKNDLKRPEKKISKTVPGQIVKLKGNKSKLKNVVTRSLISKNKFESENNKKNSTSKSKVKQVEHAQSCERLRRRTKLINVYKEESPKKLPSKKRIVEKDKIVTNEKPKSRQARKVKNYAVLAGEDSPKLPFYMKVVVKAKPPFPQDIYEFNEKVEETEAINMDSDSGNEYDKDMSSILKVIKKKEIKAAKKRQLRRKKEQPIRANEKNQKKKSNLKEEKNKVRTLKENDINTARSSCGVSQDVVQVQKILETNEQIISCDNNLHDDNHDLSNDNHVSKDDDDDIVMDNNPSLGEYFGFDEEEAPNKSNNVQVLSNVIIKKSPESLTSPWRTQIKFRSTPLVLSTKRSGLPTYDKDSKLPSPLATVNRTTNTTTNEPNFSSIFDKTSTFKKPLRQSSILNYINSTTPHEKENQDIYELSFFDEHNLSPIKLTASTPLRNLKSSNVARKILGEVNNGSLSFKDLQMGESDGSLFGFNKSDDPQVLGNKDEPTRINLREVKKVALKVCKDRNVEATGSTAAVPVDISEYDGPVVNLFEDFEPTIQHEAKACYGVKRRKHAKKVNFGDFDVQDVEENLDDSGEKKKRKQKNLRTEEEERQYQEWIKSFNAMCEEVSKCELVIE